MGSDTSPDENPPGTEIPGSPARFAPIVNTSDRYIASGSAIRSPILKPGTGEVGDAITNSGKDLQRDPDTGEPTLVLPDGTLRWVVFSTEDQTPLEALRAMYSQEELDTAPPDH